jgi:hypothetical protein
MGTKPLRPWIIQNFPALVNQAEDKKSPPHRLTVLKVGCIPATKATAEQLIGFQTKRRQTTSLEWEAVIASLLIMVSDRLDGASTLIQKAYRGLFA